jgi:hypothetical protein
VTLVQPGTPPLQVLRYHLTRGSKTASELVWDFTADTDGQRGPMPTLVLELETVVDDVLADGTAKLRITVIRTTVRDRADSTVGSDLLRAEAAALQGLVITETLSPDRRLSDSQVVTTATVATGVRARLDSVSRGLEQIAMRLPAEPVGIGASWRERRTLPAGGIRATSETTYALTSMTGDKVAYTAASLATGTPQTIEQEGLKVEVTNTHGHSEARGTVDLARATFEVTSTSTFTTAMNVVAASTVGASPSPGSGPSTVEITTAIQVTPTEADRADTAPAGSDPAPPPYDAGSSDAGLAPGDSGSAR